MTIRSDFQQQFKSIADQILAINNQPLTFSPRKQSIIRSPSERSLEKAHYNTATTKVQDLVLTITTMLAKPPVAGHETLAKSLKDKLASLRQIQGASPLEPLAIGDFPLHQYCTNMLELFDKNIPPSFEQKLPTANVIKSAKPLVVAPPRPPASPNLPRNPFSTPASPEMSHNTIGRKNSLSPIPTHKPPEKQLPAAPLKLKLEQLPVIEEEFIPLPEAKIIPSSLPKLPSFAEKLKTLKPFIPADQASPKSPRVSRETPLEDLIKNFHAAFIDRDIETLEKISALIPSRIYKKVLLTHNKAGYNLAQQACLDQDYALARFLLTDREMLKTKTLQGQTLLHLVVRKTGGVETNGALAHELIQLGIRPDEQDIEGKTPLTIAHENNDEAMVAVLRKCLPIDQQFSKETPVDDLVKNFRRACKEGNSTLLQQISPFIPNDLYKTLLNTPNEAGYTPVQQACLNLDFTMTKFFLRNKEVLITKTAKAQTLLHLVQQAGELANIACAIAKELIQFGIRPDEQDIKGKTPLDIATENKDEAMIKILNQGISPIDAQEKKETSQPLLSQKDAYNASTGPSVEDLKNVIALKLSSPSSWKSKKGTLGRSNLKGLTHLHMACNDLKKDSVDFLLEYKVDVSSLDPYGNTPLHIVVAKVPPSLAAKEKRLSIIEALLKAKAPLDVRNNEGKTPFEIATKMDDLEVISLFKKYQG